MDDRLTRDALHACRCGYVEKEESPQDASAAKSRESNHVGGANSRRSDEKGWEVDGCGNSSLTTPRIILDFPVGHDGPRIGICRRLTLR